MADTEQSTPRPDAAQAQAEAERAKAKDVRAQERARARAADDEPEEFPVERLQDEAPEFFGVGSHVVAGALDLAKFSKKNATIGEVREAIDAFLAHETE